MTRQEAVKIVIARCDVVESLRFLEEVVIEAVKQQPNDFDSIVAYCERELGIPIKINPCSVEMIASRNHIKN